MAKTIHTGAFSEGFARRKRWKVDEKLFAAALEIIPEGNTICDMGAGAGEYVKRFNDAARPAFGFDGIPNVTEISDGDVQEVDFTSEGAYDKISTMGLTKWDWVWCTEVGEHIPKHHEWKFVGLLTRLAREGIIISWATPGQRGRDHVNCRLPEYVAAILTLKGWMLDEAETIKIRNAAGKGWDRKLLVFRTNFECYTQ